MTFMTKTPSSSPILVDSREAARLLSISPRKLWELTKLGQIPSFKVGRIVRYRTADLEAWTQHQIALAASTLATGEGTVTGKAS